VAQRTSRGQQVRYEFYTPYPSSRQKFIFERRMSNEKENRYRISPLFVLDRKNYFRSDNFLTALAISGSLA